MYWDVIYVKPEENFTLHVKFSDGLEGKVRLTSSRLKKEVFQPLSKKSYFKKVHIDNGVVTWSEDLDLAPDAMHDAIKEKGEWVLS